MAEIRNAVSIRSGQSSRTRWSVVRAAQSGTEEERLAALETLLQQHAPAVARFLAVRFHLKPDVAEDWTQDFILDRVLGKRLIEKAAQERGRFRNLLLKSVSGFVLNKLRHQHAAKRSALMEALSLDELREEQGYEPAEIEAEQTFGNLFTRNVVEQAIERTHAHCTRIERSDIWAVFEGRILGPVLEEREAVSYEDLCREHGIPSVADAHNLLVSAKRIFRRELRTIVADYSDSEPDVEEELNVLKKFFEFGQDRKA